jgi:hypothetical protein
LGELEPRGESNERAMGTEQLGNANGEVYKPMSVRETDGCKGNGWGMGEWDGNNEIITEP